MDNNLSVDMDSIAEACNAIMENDELMKHYVFEDVFINEIIPLLVRPWDEQNLIKYKDYVKELTNELRIISNEKTPVVLHVIPALYPRPSTTSAETNNATVGNLTAHLHQERIRSPFPQDDILTDFLLSISVKQSVEDSVMKPLARILAVYGRAFEDDDGKPLYELKNLPQAGQNKINVAEEEGESSFTDDYED